MGRERPRISARRRHETFQLTNSVQEPAPFAKRMGCERPRMGAGRRHKTFPLANGVQGAGAACVSERGMSGRECAPSTDTRRSTFRYRARRCATVNSAVFILIVGL